MRVLVILLGLLAFASSAAAQTTPHSKANHLTENATQNYVTANEMGDRLDEGIHNHAAFAMGDADVTLTAAQHFETSFFELTGANTAVRSLILRSECGGGPSPCEKRFTVWNNTTGGFDVTVKYATGATVNVSPATVAMLQGDGTDIIQAGSLDIAQLTTEGSVDSANDLFVMWDDSASALRAVLGANLPGGAGGGGGGAFGSFRGALVHTDDVQTLTNGTWTALDWDVEDFDTDDIWEGVTNNTRFTIPAGWLKVRVCWNIHWVNSSAGARGVRVTKNGAVSGHGAGGEVYESEGTTETTHQACTGPMAVGSGDFLEVEAIQTSGGNLNVQPGTILNRVWGSIELLDPVPVSRVSDNQLVNGDFQVCQRLAGGCTFTATTTPANSDNLYGLDRWLHLTEVNDSSDYGRETSVVPGAPGATTALKSKTETANNKFGWVQILPADRSKRLIGSTASLSFKARSTTGFQVANVSAAVLCWSGTADSVTSDVVSAWGAPGTNPTFATNWTAENTPANLAVNLDAYATIKVEGISIDTTGCKNVAAFIWVDEDTAVNDLLYITDVQLEPSSLASGYQRQDFEAVLAECERHYRKSFPYATTPAQNAGTAGAVGYRIDTAGISNEGLQILFGARMFAAPTITFYNPSAANALWRNTTDAGDSGSPTADNASDSGFFARNNQIATDGVGEEALIHWSAEAEM